MILKRTSQAVLGTLLTVALSLTFTACSGGGSGVNPNEKVATINGTVVTRADYDKIYNKLAKDRKVEDMPEAQQEIFNQILKMTTMNQLIATTLVKQDAREMGIEITKEEVSNFKEQNFSSPEAKKQLEDYLNSEMMSDAEFDEMVREELLMQRVANKISDGKATVTEADAKAFYNKNNSMWKVPETIEASHILISAMDDKLQAEIKATNPSIADSEVAIEMQTKKNQLRKKAEDVMAEVRQKPGQFAELAKKYSQDPGSAKQGGYLSFVGEKTLIPEFWQALKKTPANSLYPQVLETPFGYHIVKAGEHRKPFTMSFADAKAMIIQRLQQEKMEQVMGQWLAKKQATSEISIEPNYQPAQPGQDSLGNSGGNPGDNSGVAVQQVPSEQPAQ